jgi:hypothetical protein
MDFQKKMSVSILTVIGVFVIGFILGAILLTGYINYSEQASIPDEISAPTWTSGEYWKYSFKTPDIEDAISQIVVASQEDNNYLVGVISRLDAQRHAVLNYNPMLGRIAIEDLAVYEKGVPQPLFSFPLEKGKQWSFSLFNIVDFNAEVNSIKNIKIPGGEKTTIVDIRAEAPSGDKLIYSYDNLANWIHSLVWEDSSGEIQLEMTLVTHGQGFAGTVYFVRGRDIVNNTYTAPATDFYKTPIEGHPQWGPFDSLIYHFIVSTQDNSGGTLIIKDPTSNLEAMARVFGPNIFESSLGTIPSNSDDLSITVTLFGEAHLHIRIAGGIEYIWNV